MKRNLLIIGVAFAITLAIIFGTRISPDALAVVIGVLLGIAASVPTTLLVVFILTRQQNRLEKSAQPMFQQPPVFVINAGDKPQPLAPPALPAPYLSAADTGRKWTVIGDVDTDM
jgi:hypothetical protein